MDENSYTDAELERYFRDREARHARGDGNGTPGDGSPAPAPPAPRPAPRSTQGALSPAELRRRVWLTIRALLIGVGVVAALVALWLLWLSRDLPSTAVIENPKNLLATVVYTADGEELARYYERENRTWVPLDSISQHVVHALIATEDRAFYDHWGVHLRRTLQAPLTFILNPDLPQGGSTITQQLARNLYREQVEFELGDRSVIRKIKEILTAIRIERIYTKDEIIEAYLNTVPFRYNAYGIEAASQTYFDKTAFELNPEESAALVGMLAANTLYDPARNPENAQRRRNVVLRNMVTVGFLDEAYYQQVRDAPIDIEGTFKPYSHEDNLAPHFAEFLRQWFKDWCDANGYDPYSDGLKIITTLDADMQRLATEAFQEQMRGLQAVVDVEWGRPAALGLGTMPAPYVRRMERGGVEPFGTWWARNTRIVNEYIAGTEAFRRLTASGLDRDEAVERLRGDADFVDSLRAVKTRLEGGLVAMSPETGNVLAWVGGVNFAADKYDHVGLARRQPGSTFKPFAYVAAFDNGYSPNYYVLDAPFSWDGWRPLNYGGGASGGYVSLRSGLANSMNIPTARVTKLVGAAEVARYARRLGVRSPLDLTPYDASDEETIPNSIGLGVTDVTLLEMVTAYATLANYGVYHEPTFVHRIEDRYGNVVAQFSPTGREVISPSTAYTAVDVLKDVVARGTAVGLRPRFDVGGIELAGKTGTTQESADGWFIAMNPELVVGAWVGWNDRRITFRSSFWGQGSHTGLYLVGAFLETLQNEGDPDIRIDPDATFEEPPNYQPPSRTGYDGSGPRRGRSDDPNVTADRPARDLLRRWRDRDGGDNDGGRIGW
ncbi:MAG: transglycosylase domain-containing protein [Rubricoccaceae bacterium]|nr:transglycosylase domain-containing protein [Rubricoccaceae bacterium]